MAGGVEIIWKGEALFPSDCRESGDPPSLCREGKRKLTESAKEFSKASSRQRPGGSL